MTLPFAYDSGRLRRSCVWLNATWLIAVLWCSSSFALDDRVDNIMNQDPAFLYPTEQVVFPDNLTPLWLQALARPDSELQRMSADTIALAHRAGMPGLNETADELLAVLQREQLEPSVRRAVARALASIDARQAAELFLKIAETGSQEMAKIVEPALARWDHKPARAMWLQRLADTEVERTRLHLAVQCLGIVKDTEALPTLLELVHDVNAEIPIRLSAARASAAIGGEGLIAAARALASVEAGQPIASLLGATLLTEIDSPDAVSILKQVAASDSVTASGLALRQLLEVDPAHVYGFAATAIRSADVNIRRVGCEALVHRANIDSVALLARLLDDPNPGIRRDVSRWLIRFAEQESLRQAVIDATSEVISHDPWRGVEQALIVLATLDYEPAAPRFIELMMHRRPEVSVTAAWGLQELGVAETLPAMLAQAERQTTLVADETYDPLYLLAIDGQLSHLFQGFGRLGYAEAEPLMRRFIPKTLLYGGDARAAAVWAIGKLNEGKLDEELAKQFGERLSDVASPLPEVEPVRAMSAVGIGRMKAESQLPALRQFIGELPGFAGQACNWAIERITGETREFRLHGIRTPSNWFLMPKTSDRSGESE